MLFALLSRNIAGGLLQSCSYRFLFPRLQEHLPIFDPMLASQLVQVRASYYCTYEERLTTISRVARDPDFPDKQVILRSQAIASTCEQRHPLRVAINNSGQSDGGSAQGRDGGDFLLQFKDGVSPCRGNQR